MASQKKRQSLSKQCDTLCAEIIKRRAGHECQSRRDVVHDFAVQWAHGFGRGYHAVRWDLRNSWCLCRSCHMYYTHRPIQWDDWMRETLGEAEYADLRALAVTYVTPDLKETRDSLKAVLGSLDEDLTTA